MSDELFEQFQQACMNCEFDKASEIKRQMDLEEREDKDGQFTRHVESITNLVNDCKAQYEQECSDLKEALANHELIVRKKISEIFRELQIRHVEVLVEYEKENLLKYTRDKMRPMPHVEELRKQAKLAAYNQKFAQAEDLKHQAALLEESTRNQRDDIKQRYLKGRADIMNKQKRDLGELVNQLHLSLESIKKREQHELVTLRKRYRKALQESFHTAMLLIRAKKGWDAATRNLCLVQCSNVYSTLIKEIEAESV